MSFYKKKGARYKKSAQSFYYKKPYIIKNTMMTNIITEVIFVGCLLFLIGIFGIILNNKSLIHMLMSIELMLLAANLFLVTFSLANDDIMGEVLALLVLGVAGAESAIGLAILVAYYRKKGTLTLN